MGTEERSEEKEVRESLLKNVDKESVLKTTILNFYVMFCYKCTENIQSKIKMDRNCYWGTIGTNPIYNNYHLDI